MVSPSTKQDSLGFLVEHHAVRQGPDLFDVIAGEKNPKLQGLVEPGLIKRAGFPQHNEAFVPTNEDGQVLGDGMAGEDVGTDEDLRNGHCYVRKGLKSKRMNGKGTGGWMWIVAQGRNAGGGWKADEFQE